MNRFNKLLEEFNEMFEVYPTQAESGMDTYLIFDGTADSKKFEEFAKEKGYNNIESDLNIEIVYSDEYYVCKCGNAINRTYDTFYLDNQDNLHCRDCFEKSEDLKLEYMEDKINDYNDANTMLEDVYLANRGFIKLDKEYFSGLHEGDNDNPKEIFENLQKKYNEIIFSVDSKDYFTTTFSVWVRDVIE